METDERLCCVPHILVKTGQGIICMDATSGRVTPLEPEEVKVLRAMHRFETLDVQLSHLTGEPGAPESRTSAALLEERVLSSIRRFLLRGHADERKQRYTEVIGRLTAEGLVTSSNVFVSRLVQRPDQYVRPVIASLAIPTCKRPVSLAETVNSFLVAAQRHGRSDLKVLLVDNSQEERAEAANRRACREFSREWKGDVSYIGTAQLDYILKSASRDVDSRDLEFAFRPDTLLPTDGAARNLIMGVLLGETVLHADDDTTYSFIHTDIRPGRLGAC